MPTVLFPSLTGRPHPLPWAGLITKGDVLTYEKPEIVDYGDLVELTANLGPGGSEDGGNKVFHTTHPL